MKKEEAMLFAIGTPKRDSDDDYEDSEISSDDSYSKEEDYAEEMIEALNSGDAKAFARALKDFIYVCVK